MIYVISNAWALLLGIMLLQVGNGLQGTLLAVRGADLNLDPSTLSLIMSAYFVGFLGGSRAAPWLIRRVGHVRVFAALASLISAVFILYPALPFAWSWVILRLIVGFCFSGAYVVAESWLNDVSTNETRGKVLSAYLVAQMAGIIAAQSFVNFADPNGYLLFVVMSVLVSFSFLPILLSISPVPAFERTKPMSLLDLYRTSPLGIVGLFFLGAIFGALFGMSAVYGTEKGMSLGELSLFVATIYIGSLVMQFPIGFISDRMDRRLMILGVTGAGAVLVLLAMPYVSDFNVLLAIAFVVGGISTPLYSLLLAYTNDYLDHDDMAAAAGGMLFVNGVGAILGPIVAGAMMSRLGPDSYFLFVAALFAMISLYALFRTTRRAAPTVEETGSYAALTPTASPVALEIAQEMAVDLAVEIEEAAAAEEGDQGSSNGDENVT